MSKRTTKKALRMSASAARVSGSEDAARTDRARKAAIREIGRRQADNAAGATTAPKAKAPKDAKPTPAKRVSLLDAAATVLADAKAPMQAKAIVDAVARRGLWKPGAGKTPHATLFAAMTREIADKGKDARFRKAERGQFVAEKGA